MYYKPKFGEEMEIINAAPSELEIHHCLEMLLPKLQVKIDKWYNQHAKQSLTVGKTFLSESAPPILRVEQGRVYWKLIKESRSEFGGASSTVYGFIRRADGAILRAATWKKPETRTKSAIRGYITEEFCEDYFTSHGVVYAI